MTWKEMVDEATSGGSGHSLLMLLVTIGLGLSSWTLMAVHDQAVTQGRSDTRLADLIEIVNKRIAYDDIVIHDVQIRLDAEDAAISAIRQELMDSHGHH